MLTEPEQLFTLENAAKIEGRCRHVIQKRIDKGEYETIADGDARLIPLSSILRRRQKWTSPITRGWRAEEWVLLEKGLDRGWTAEKISELFWAYGFHRDPSSIGTQIQRRRMRRGDPRHVKPIPHPTPEDWVEYIKQLLPFLPQEKP